jgi:hypothetical protein
VVAAAEVKVSCAEVDETTSQKPRILLTLLGSKLRSAGMHVTGRWVIVAGWGAVRRR